MLTTLCTFNVIVTGKQGVGVRGLRGPYAPVTGTLMVTWAEMTPAAAATAVKGSPGS